MNYIYYCILFLFSLNIFSNPWIDDDNLNLKFYIDKLNFYCSTNILPESFSPTPLTYIDSKLKKLKIEDQNSKCSFYYYKLNNEIEKSFNGKNIIGITNNADNVFLQEKGYRFNTKDNIYFKSSKTLNRFSYNFQINNTENDTNMDGSSISYLTNKDYVVSFGRIHRWWSPSNETSLILSNSARPFPSISISNYKPLNLDYPFLKIFNDIYFEVFIGELEKDRHISKAKIFGNRLTFSPHKNASISFLRVAQFGGEDRAVDFDIFKNMILGKDTTNRYLSYEDQPGNQIAGIDFMLNINKYINLYGQILGEDGLDPIFKGSGAIFPSKRFGLGGIELKNFYADKPWSLRIEHINTDSGFKNITYNHEIYKSGYRYFEEPIGSSIDGDSHKSLIKFEKYFSSSSKMILKHQKINLNQNMNKASKWGVLKLNGDISSLRYTQIYGKFLFDLLYEKRDLNFMSKNLFLIRLEYSL